MPLRLVMNSQSPITVGMEPPDMAKAHFTFSFGTSAALRPGLAWKRLELAWAPTLAQSLGVGWIGGFLPVTVFAIVSGTGDIFAGLWYPFIFTAISLVAALFFLPETRKRSLDF